MRPWIEQRTAAEGRGEMAAVNGEMITANPFQPTDDTERALHMAWKAAYQKKFLELRNLK